MCGRYTQWFYWREVHYFLNLTGPALNLRPPYDVAPGQDVAVVRAAEDGRRLSMLRWGLIPFWSRESNIGCRMINARAETAAGKPPFRAAYRARRCLIPADAMTLQPVSTWVNKASNDDARCLEGLGRSMS